MEQTTAGEAVSLGGIKEAVSVRARVDAEGVRACSGTYWGIRASALCRSSPCGLEVGGQLGAVSEFEQLRNMSSWKEGIQAGVQANGCGLSAF